MSNVKNELRINALLNKVAKRNAGFAIKVVGVCQWSGEVKIIQTTKNANAEKLEKKHEFVLLEKLVSDEHLKAHLVMEKAEFKKEKVVLRAAEKTMPISQSKQFAQLVSDGVKCEDAWNIVNQPVTVFYTVEELS